MTPPVPPPQDPGLQVERTSLSWARMWTAMAVALAACARLTFEVSPWLALFFGMVVIGPMAGLAFFEQRHIERAHWFLGADSGSRQAPIYRWLPLAVVTGMCVVLALLAIVVIALRPAA